MPHSPISTTEQMYSVSLRSLSVVFRIASQLGLSRVKSVWSVVHRYSRILSLRLNPSSLSQPSMRTEALRSSSHSLFSSYHRSQLSISITRSSSKPMMGSLLRTSVDHHQHRPRNATRATVSNTPVHSMVARTAVLQKKRRLKPLRRTTS